MNVTIRTTAGFYLVYAEGVFRIGEPPEIICFKKGKTKYVFKNKQHWLTGYELIWGNC